MKAKIHITLKSGILDPQGKAIEHALETRFAEDQLDRPSTERHHRGGLPPAPSGRVRGAIPNGPQGLSREPVSP